ncbi:MAG: DUF3606 domain-containing protein [Salinisphaera sp.]|nr:DUF3606 domain-containing protein [Salinisphaera sp.]
MSDDLNNAGPADAARINVHQDHELDYWSDALECDEETLRAAVDAVGVMADDVRAHLARLAGEG